MQTDIRSTRTKSYIEYSEFCLIIAVLPDKYLNDVALHFRKHGGENCWRYTKARDEIGLRIEARKLNIE